MISKDERAKRTYRLLKPYVGDGLSWGQIQSLVADWKKEDFTLPKEERKFDWITAWGKHSLMHQYAKGEKLIERDAPKPFGKRIFKEDGRGGLLRTVLEYDTLENAMMAEIMDRKEGD